MLKPVKYKNLDFSKTYSANYIHPEFDYNTPRDTSHLIPEQVRKNKSYDFKPLGHTQVCPANFKAIPDTSSGRNVIKCVYDRTKEVRREEQSIVQIPTPSSTFDMRSNNPNGVGYSVFYKSKNANTTQKYIPV
jgi:hypothetical protein